MTFKTEKAFMLRDNNGKWQEIPLEVMSALKEIGLTVVFVDGEVGCYASFAAKMTR